MRGGEERIGVLVVQLTYPSDHLPDQSVSCTEVIWVSTSQQLMQHLQREREEEEGEGEGRSKSILATLVNLLPKLSIVSMYM